MFVRIGHRVVDWTVGGRGTLHQRRILTIMGESTEGMVMEPQSAQYSVDGGPGRNGEAQGSGLVSSGEMTRR